MKKNIFYFIPSSHDYLICDISCCAQSERSFDIPFFDIANNEKLLDKLHLYYMRGNYGVRYTYTTRAQWFCGYLSSFYPEDKEQHEKSLKNPIVRLLIQNDRLLSEVKEILKVELVC